MRNETWKNETDFNNLLETRSGITRNSEEYKEITKKLKKRIQLLKNLRLSKEAETLNNYSSKKEIEKLYRSIKSDSSAFRKIYDKQQCDPLKLKEYFAQHFSGKELKGSPDEFENVPDFVTHLQAISEKNKIDTSPPGKHELYLIIKKLKSGKAANDIPIEYMKCALENPLFLSEMVELYRTVWETWLVPANWGHSKLVATWKGAAKGRRDDPAAYRALQIGSSLCKVMVVIIIERIKTWYECQLLDCQHGFRSGRSTVDGIYNLKRMHQRPPQ